MEWRQPFAAFLLPDRRGENLPPLLFAVASRVLRLRVGHDDRIFVEPHLRKVGEREAVDHTSRVRDTFQELLLALEYPAIGDAYGVVREPPHRLFWIMVFPALPAGFFITLECLLYGCIRLREQQDCG